MSTETPRGVISRCGRALTPRALPAPPDPALARRTYVNLCAYSCGQVDNLGDAAAAGTEHAEPPRASRRRPSLHHCFRRLFGGGVLVTCQARHVPQRYGRLKTKAPYLLAISRMADSASS